MTFSMLMSKGVLNVNVLKILLSSIHSELE